MYQPYQLFLSLRYIRVKKKNHFISFISLFSILGISLGVMALIIVMSIMNGFHKEIRERILSMTSHITVTSVKGYLEEWPKGIKTVLKHPEVIGAAPYIDMQIMIASGPLVSGGLIHGIDPELEHKVSDIKEKIVLGSIKNLQSNKFNIILGSVLATNLMVNIGDKIMIITPQTMITSIGAIPRIKQFKVSGIFETDMNEYDSNMAFIHIHDASKLGQFGQNVTGLRLKVKDPLDTEFILQELSRKIPNNYILSDWSYQYKNFFRVLKMEKRMIIILLTLIILVAAFNIISMMVIIVKDKCSNIAILRTLGISSSSILFIFMIQGSIIGILGIIIGIIFGILISLNIEIIVKIIELLFNFQFINPDLYYITKVPSDLHWNDVILISIITFIITIGATLYPAWLASHIEPAEALHYE